MRRRLLAGGIALGLLLAGCGERVTTKPKTSHPRSAPALKPTGWKLLTGWSDTDDGDNQAAVAVVDGYCEIVYRFSNSYIGEWQYSPGPLVPGADPNC